MSSSLVGKTLGQYQILREIGRGGMAVVYEAYQPALVRTVAIKVLPPQLALDQQFVQRFLLEARSAARLEHPNIVTIHDVGVADGVYYIVMQKLAGEPLNVLIRRATRLPPKRAVRIAAQVALALDYAHQNRVVHRDIKPANIIVDAHDHAVLTDFGIAKAAEGGGLTRTGIAMGTPEYMSPEQANGQPVGPASDIYSLGIVLYEMLAGQAPFRADSTPAVLYKQVYERPAPVRGLVPGVPVALEQVLATALTKDPAQRYRRGRDMAAALQLAGAQADAAEQMTRPATGKRPQPQAVAGSRRGVQTDRRTLALAIGVGVIGIVALLMILLAAFGPGRAGVTPTPALEAANPLSPAPTRRVATATPIPRRTAKASPAPSGGVASEDKPRVIARQDVNVYAGPGRAYTVMGRIAAGQRLDVINRDPETFWWRACCLDGEPVWVEAALVDAAGATYSVPPATGAPLAAPHAGPSRTPAPLPPSVPTATRRAASPTRAPTTAPGSAAKAQGACRGEKSLEPVVLTSPRSDATCNGPVRFTWQWQYALRPGEQFELHLWPEYKQNRGAVARTTGNSVVVDLRRDVKWINWEQAHHRWEVLVVCTADEHWVTRESEARLLYFWPAEPYNAANPDANCK
jgi:hypothetical protein